MTCSERRSLELWGSCFQDAARPPLILTVRAESTGPGALKLTCSTMGGNVAATLEWPSDAPTSGLANAIAAAVESSGFECPIKPLRAWNLRLLSQDGAQLAPMSTLAEQLGLEATTSASSGPPPSPETAVDCQGLVSE